MKYSVPKGVFVATALLGALICVGARPALAPDRAAGTTAHWSYSGADGPEHWGDLDPSFAACKNGTRQAPINIADAKLADLPPIRFDYQLAPLRIINNGHTIRVNYAPGSWIVIGNKRYQLEQLHFHHPAEEEIAGRRFDLVAHLVHQSADGQFAVVSILFKQGAANPFLQQVWNHAPTEPGKEIEIKKVVLNVADLLPTGRNYYSLAGSLTTPPCSEGITFYVMKDVQELSAEQIAQFAKLYPDNARPIQPTNGREILESHFQ